MSRNIDRYSGNKIGKNKKIIYTPESVDDI